MLKILSPGTQSLLVDKGRSGYQHLGLTCTGPLDLVAYYWAARLSGASETDSLTMIEAVGCVEFVLTKPAWVVATGPEVDIVISNRNYSGWQAHFIDTDQPIKISTKRIGQRSYICVNGGFTVPKITGTATSVVREKIGGLDGEGSLLRPGDTLKYDKQPVNVAVTQQIQPFNYDLDGPIRLVMGYQKDAFSSLAKATFFSSNFTKSSQSDRMGAKLRGPVIASPSGAFLSEGLHLGAVQIPPNGQPIVMLADRQTLGGYPKIASVARIDIARFAQALPGDNLQFAPVSTHTARNLWRLQHLRWDKGMM